MINREKITKVAFWYVYNFFYEEKYIEFTYNEIRAIICLSPLLIITNVLTLALFIVLFILSIVVFIIKFLFFTPCTNDYPGRRTYIENKPIPKIDFVVVEMPIKK